MTLRHLNIALAVAASLLVLIGAPWLAAQMSSLPGAGALSARSGQRIVSLEVTGMQCAACGEPVRVSLVNTPGVRTVEVRPAQSRAYVVCDKRLADSTLIAAVHRAGPSYGAAIAAR